MKHIIVGIDGSKNAERALAWGLGEARHHGAELIVAHAWSPTMLYDAEIASPPGEDLRTAAMQLLDDTVERVVGPEPGVILESTLIPQPAGESLVTLAGGDDLLVVGSTGHGAIARLLLGSVSTYCARHARCPVVIVPTGSGD
jgi:nucleotide-binding universal stress UspA family protein